jgi:hypothetical protein
MKNETSWFITQIIHFQLAIGILTFYLAMTGWNQIILTLLYTSFIPIYI